MDTILMTPDVAMQFMIWSYYYHNIFPEKNASYSKCGRFSESDAKRLDELKDMLFRCFEEESVFNACKQFQLAKTRNEACPFTQQQLDSLFAKELQ